MGWIVAVVVALGAVFPAYAKPAKAAQPAARFEANLLTWQQFVALPKKKQEKYLAQVRELIMFMESMQNKFDHETASNSAVDELKEQVAVMMQLMAVMPEAYADDEEFGLEKPAADAKGKPAAAPASDAKGRPSAAPAVRGGRPVTTGVDQNGKPTATVDPKDKLVKPVSEPPKPPAKPAAEPPKVAAPAKPAPPKAPIASSPESAAAMEAALKNPAPPTAGGQETDGGGNKIWEKRAEAKKPFDDEVPHWENGKGWVCGEKFLFHEPYGTCVHRKPTWSWWGVGGGGGTTYGEGECPQQSEQMSWDIPIKEGAQFRCIPIQAWNSLSPVRRDQILGGSRYPADFFKKKVGLGPEATMDHVLGGKTHNADGSTVGSGNGEMAGTADAPPPPPAAGPGNPDKTDSAKVEPPKTEPVACVREQLSCEKMSDKDRAKLKSKFPRKGKGIPCIIGGVFSEYERKGKCKPQPGQLNHLCKKSDTTMCDVGVFCLGMILDEKVKAHISGLPEGDEKKNLVDEMNHAFTVKGTGEKIVRMKICPKVVEKVDKAKDVDVSYRCNMTLKGHLEGKTSPFEGTPIGEKYKICNPAQLEGGPAAGWGDQEGWNNRRENVRKMYNLWCNNKDGRNASFGAYFCKECGIIAERIMAMNKEAVGDPCINGQRVRSGGSTPAANPVDNPGIINEDEGDGI